MVCFVLNGGIELALILLSFLPSVMDEVMKVGGRSVRGRQHSLRDLESSGVFWGTVDHGVPNANGVGTQRSAWHSLQSCPTGGECAGDSGPRSV
jgi:hypothetical protein